MRIDRYTQRMQEALQAAQDLASQLNNSEITNEHFLSALLDQSDGIARPLLEKIGANVDQLQERLRSDLESRPKIHGSAADLRMGCEIELRVSGSARVSRFWRARPRDCGLLLGFVLSHRKRSER